MPVLPSAGVNFNFSSVFGIYAATSNQDPLPVQDFTGAFVLALFGEAV